MDKGMEQALVAYREQVVGRRSRRSAGGKGGDNDAWRTLTDWKGEFRRKERILGECFAEVSPQEFIREIFPPETLSTFYPRDLEINTGKPCGIVKYYIGVTDKGKAKMRKELLYDNYQAFEQTQDSRFALLGLCTYFGIQGNKNARPSACHGIAIDLDAVRERELVNLLGLMDADMLPRPTYLVNSGHGLHLYYIFEDPVSLQDANAITFLHKVKRELINMVWTSQTSADSYKQYQGIFQDMRTPGSWTKFGMRNKGRCSYIIRAFRTGKPVSLSYLTRALQERFPELESEWAAPLERVRIPLEQAKELYPNWYQRVVVEGHRSERGCYTQNRGLYDWWMHIITQETDRAVKTSREGNRWNCIVVLYVMGYKCDIPLGEVVLDANDLIPFMNEKEHAPDNEFTLDDVLSAAKYYNKKYVKWSNKTIAERCSIELPPPASRRNGRTRAEHLQRARVLRSLSTYDNVGRPKGSGTKASIVAEWRAHNPEGTKAACMRETKLSKQTVYTWWNFEG